MRPGRDRYSDTNSLVALVFVLVLIIAMLVVAVEFEWGKEYGAEKVAAEPVMITEYKKDPTYDSKRNRYVREQKERVQNLNRDLETLNVLLEEQDRTNPEWEGKVTKILVDMEVETRRIMNADVPWAFLECHSRYMQDGVVYLTQALILLPLELYDPTERDLTEMHRVQEYVERFHQATRVYNKEIEDLMER